MRNSAFLNMDILLANPPKLRVSSLNNSSLQLRGSFYKTPQKSFAIYMATFINQKWREKIRNCIWRSIWKNDAFSFL